MKLAIFSPNVLPVPALDGGAVEELTTYLIEENEKKHIYDIDLYTIDNNNRLSNFQYKYTNIIQAKYEDNSFKTGIIDLKNKFLRRMPNGRIISNFSEHLTRNYKRNYYDAVLVEDNRQVFNSVVGKINHEKLIFHVHDDIDVPDYHPSKLQLLISPKDYNLMKGITNSANKIITVSNYLKKKIERCGATNVETLYNSVLAQDLVPISLKKQISWKTKLGISNDDVIFTFIGRFTSDKGLDKLLLALKFLKKYDNLRLLIVGKNWLHSEKENEYTFKLKKIMESMPDKLKSRIIFIGYIDHSKINEIYSISDCIVIPSQCEEAFGMVALEAMTMGVPVIASNSGGLPEVLGESAIMINLGANFILDLSKAIIKVYLNPNLRQEMANKGKKESHKFPKTKEEYFNNFSKIVK